MNLKFHIICITIALTLVVPAVADNNTAKVYGGVYSSETFEPLYNVVVSVNSIPSQYMLAKSGTYIFDLAPGNYSITAKYYDNNTLISSATDNITIEMVGSYRHDLLLLPIYSIELMGDSTENLLSNNSSSGELAAKRSLTRANESNSVNIPEQSRIYSSTVNYFLVLFTLVLILAIGFSLFKKRKRIEKNSSEEKNRHATGDLYRISNEPEFSIVKDKSTDPEEELEFKVPLSKPIVTLDSKISAKEKNHEDEAELVDLNAELAPKKQPILHADLQEVMDIIKDQGGRITQKDLRRKLKKYSEGKVSLMLTDLESRELIKKFKKGRGNIVILNDEER
jgi:uncharacterized membrane protein